MIIPACLRNDISSAIIKLVRHDVCIGLNIKPLFNFIIKDVKFLCHNHFDIDMYWIKGGELFLRIIENEAIKCLSDINSGCLIDTLKMNVSSEEFTESSKVNSGLYFYFKMLTEFSEQSKYDLYRTYIKNEISLFNKFSSENLFFTFDMVK